MDTAVDDRLFHRLEAFLPADDQLAKGKDKVRLQSNRVILLRIVRVDIHGIDILRTGRTDLDNLTVKAVHQRCVFRFRIADDNVVIRHQERIGDLTLGAEGFTGTGCAEDQAVRVFQKLPVYHDQVVGNGVQTVVQSFLPILEKFLRRKGDHDSGRTAGHLPLNRDQVLGQRQTAHQGIFLLEVQAAQVAAVLLRDTGCLEIVGFQLLRRFPGIHHKESNPEHTLILAL